MIQAGILLIAITISAASVHADCVCDAQVHGPQTQLAALEDDEVAAKIAPNPLDGTYFVGWLSTHNLSSREEATRVQGQIFDRSLKSISAAIIFENNPGHTPGDAVFIGGAVFNTQRREYFVVTANVTFTPKGRKYEVLRAHIVSDRGILKKGNILLADTLAFPGSHLAWNQTDVIFNNVNREYVVKHAIFLSGQPRTIIQSFDENVTKKKKVILFGSGHLRFDFRANQYLFASSGIENNNFKIKAQLLNSQLKRVGPLNIVLNVPYVFSDPYSHTGPFPIYNPVRSKFVIFWYEGPWNNSKVFERSLSTDGRLDPAVSTGIVRKIVEMRFNPETAGYILISRSREVLRIDDRYRITSQFPFTCQNPGLAPPAIAYNRFSPELLFVWFYPIASGKNIDLYARRFAASIPLDSCRSN